MGLKFLNERACNTSFETRGFEKVWKNFAICEARIRGLVGLNSCAYIEKGMDQQNWHNIMQSWINIKQNQTCFQASIFKDSCHI